MTRSLAGIPVNKLVSAALIAVATSSLLLGYELIRSPSQSLYIEAYGAARLPIVMALGPLGTILAIWGYGHLLSAAGAKRATIICSLGSALLMLACYAMIRRGNHPATAVLYVIREAYIVLLVEQVWAFINSTLCTQEGRKLNGPICGIASLGAIAGGFLVKAYAQRIGTDHLLLLCAASLVPTGLLTAAAYHFGGEPQPTAEELGGRQGHMGGRLLARTPLLRNLAALIIATQVVATVFDLQLSRLVEVALPLRDERTAWFGSLYAWLNVGAAFFQFVGAPLLLRYAPLRPIHLGIPVVHAALALAAVFHPSLAIAAAAYMAFKVLDYSVFRAAKELLYVPLSFDARYRAKELIDAFGYRFAKGAASGLLALAGRFGTIPVVALPATALVALLAWGGLVVPLTRRRDEQ